ncbi:MAG: hypothetical protein WCH04_08280 [Gammaproteobacteria bacterium]
MSTQRSPFYCLMPVTALLIGSGLAWFIHGFVDVNMPKLIAEIATRFFSLIVGMTFWGLGFVFAQKRMFCGGVEDLTEETRLYHHAGAFLAIALLIIAGMLLATGSLLLYFIVVVILAALFAGEIGWGEPFRLIW